MEGGGEGEKYPLPGCSRPGNESSWKWHYKLESERRKEVRQVRAIIGWVIVVIKVMGKEGFSYWNENKSEVSFKQWHSVPLKNCQCFPLLL